MLSIREFVPREESWRAADRTVKREEIGQRVKRHASGWMLLRKVLWRDNNRIEILDRNPGRAVGERSCKSGSKLTRKISEWRVSNLVEVRRSFKRGVEHAPRDPEACGSRRHQNFPQNTFMVAK